MPDEIVVAIGRYLLDHVDEYVDAILASRHDVPGYDVLPADLLRPATLAASTALIHAMFIEQRGPSDDERRRARQIFMGRLQLGVTVKDIARGMSLRPLWAAAEAAAEQLGYERGVLIGAAPLVFEMEHAMLEAAADAQREVEHTAVFAQQQLQSRILHALLVAGEPVADDVLLGAGVHPEHDYVPFRSRDLDVSAIGAPLTGLIGGDSAGLVADDGVLATAVVAMPTVTIAVGPAAPPAQLRSSFRAASIALTTGLAFGRRGIVRLEDLGVLPAVVADGELGGRIVQRYLGSLDQLRSFGTELRHTIATYLDTGTRLDETARRLCIHRNTLKYRLRKYEELTKTDLHRTEDIVHIWWALQRAAVDACSE